MSDTVTLLSADGKELRFEQVAGIQLGTQQYAVLSPVEEIPGIQKNQALIFAVDSGDPRRASLRLVTDPAVIEAVFQEYSAIMQKEFEKCSSEVSK